MMGTVKKGILDGFSGKVGTVVGGSWKGINYMRSIPAKRKDARTEKQVGQRTKFALTLAYLKPINPLLRVGWKLYANKQSPFNAAMSYALANAITGVFPDYRIDPAKVLISHGSLTPPSEALASKENGSITLSWEDNSGIGSAKQTDKALIAVVNQALGDALIDSTETERMEKGVTLPIPADWTSDSLDIYLGFVSEDGKEVANSVYLGSITML